jgi:hypothetical protein
MRGRFVAVVTLLLGSVGLLAPAPAPAACTDDQCGVPECWSTPLRVRPDMPRTLRVSCSRVVSAKLVSGPAHGTISDVSSNWGMLAFTIRANADAPRDDEVVFEVAGEWETIEQRFPIEVKPLAENLPPTCYGAEAKQRSDGKGPVDVYLWPYCYDPDGDEFSARGDGPGVHVEERVEFGANETLSSWRYRTAIHVGTEIARLWTTDVLGARSEDAELKMTVGPDVDRLPECYPQPGTWSYSGLPTIATRPGVTRRFGIVCTDWDADPFVTAITAPPKRGALATVPVGPGHEPSGYTQQSLEATYVPVGDSMEPDEFTLTAAGSRGTAEQRVSIVPRALPENGYGGCSYGGIWTSTGVAATAQLDCHDEEGDELSVEIVDAPRHGTLGPVLTVPAPMGSVRHTVEYLPEPGFKGYDCFKVAIFDAHGFRSEMLIEVNVGETPIFLPPLPYPDPLPPLPFPLPPAFPPSGRPGPPPRAVEAMVKGYVKQALDTPTVRRLPSTGDAQVWAPARLSKRELLRDGVEPAMVVLCPSGCRLRSDTELFTGSRTRARKSRRQTAQVLGPGQGHLLLLTVTEDQRTPLSRAPRARADVRLGLRPPGRKPRTVKRAIAFGR